MFRVLFKVERICIHIKETIQLEVLFKKGTDSILIKGLFPLVDGIAYINITDEFLIAKQQPTFEVHVNFTFKKMKKQAGYIQLNLKDFSEECSYQQIRTLQNSPGGKAIIQFGFIYFDSGVASLPKSLQSLEAFEKGMNQQYRSQVQRHNSILINKLKQLKNQKEQLAGFQENLSRVEAEFQKIEAHLSEEICSQLRMMDESQVSLKQEQEKNAFLLQLVRKSGSMDLISSVQGLDMIEVEQEQNKSFEQ